MITSPHAEAAGLIDRMSGLQAIMWLSIGRYLLEDRELDPAPGPSNNVIEGPWDFHRALGLAESGGMI